MATRLSLALALILLILPGCDKQPRVPKEPQYYTHTISYQGETLALIASWYTGAAKNWQALLPHNPGLDVKRIRLGTVVRIPEGMLVRRDPMPQKLLKGGKRGEGPTVAVDEAAVEESLASQDAAAVETVQPTPQGSDSPYLPATLQDIDASPTSTPVSPDATAVVAQTPFPTNNVLEQPRATPMQETEPQAVQTPIPTPARQDVNKTRDELLEELLEQ